MFRARAFRKKHPRVESAPRDDRSSEFNYKRVENDRDMSLLSWKFRTLFLPRSMAGLVAGDAAVSPQHYILRLTLAALEGDSGSGPLRRCCVQINRRFGTSRPNSRARSRRRRFGRFLDGSMALIEFSKQSGCVKTVEYAHIEVELKI